MAPYVSEAFIPGFDVVGKYVSLVKHPKNLIRIPWNISLIFFQLYFINSATSFYFIYDFCLHSNLSPLVSYFLRYLPLFAALIVFPIIWIIRYMYMYISNHN